MKSWKLISAAFLLVFFFYTPHAEAQVARRNKVHVVKRNGPVKRKVRRKKRRIQHRTLRRLPAKTNVIRYRDAAYYPVGGMYYIARNKAYVRAFPPRGFRVRNLPGRMTHLIVRGVAYYYASGIFYQNVEDEYEVVTSPVGAVIKELPEDTEEMNFDGITTYELNETLYRAIEDGYEVIELLEDH